MADDPFVSLTPVPAQVVTIRPMNEPGLPGVPAPHVKIQYSTDGSTDWHDAPTLEDKYFRMSTDDGATWGEALYWGNTADAEAARVAAEAARDKAAQWAENPENVEVEAGQYSALHHKEKALDAQIAAAASATAASTSEGNALASENKAHKWAEEDEDVQVQTGEYSAYHWAQKAAYFAPLIEDQVVDGITTKTASQNAIYDALVMLERKVGGGILI
jgi:hypothetical protein